MLAYGYLYVKPVRAECFMSLTNKTYRSMNSFERLLVFTLRYIRLRHKWLRRTLRANGMLALKYQFEILVIEGRVK
jgi:hypothetical protein